MANKYETQRSAEQDPAIADISDRTRSTLHERLRQGIASVGRGTRTVIGVVGDSVREVVHTALDAGATTANIAGTAAAGILNMKDALSDSYKRTRNRSDEERRKAV